MARRRFFVNEVRRGAAELTGPDAEHLVRVLRAEAGQQYEICDNQSTFLAEIITAQKSLVKFRIVEELAPPPTTATVQLCPALFKFDRFEWMIEKATELGATSIHPFDATRSERGLVEAAPKRLPRWAKIALEASQQARRDRLPTIHQPVFLEEALQEASGLRLFLDEDHSAAAILDVIENLPGERSRSDTISLMSGPEGGWTNEERQKVTEQGWLACSLGSTILRAETAIVSGLSIVNAVWKK
jgi:16S rRNA (uracil1498-N3)-methyltransferase